MAPRSHYDYVKRAAAKRLVRAFLGKVYVPTPDGWGRRDTDSAICGIVECCIVIGSVAYRLSKLFLGILFGYIAGKLSSIPLVVVSALFLVLLDEVVWRVLGKFARESPWKDRVFEWNPSAILISKGFVERSQEQTLSVQIACRTCANILKAEEVNDFGTEILCRKCGTMNSISVHPVDTYGSRFGQATVDTSAAASLSKDENAMVAGVAC